MDPRTLNTTLVWGMSLSSHLLINAVSVFRDIASGGKTTGRSNLRLALKNRKSFMYFPTTSLTKPHTNSEGYYSPQVGKAGGLTCTDQGKEVSWR
ncbi:hypothetical protein G3M48_001367 [Beauveria asiatica]|uniref:Secreted protein n=1 Tax=Beauveria asiatica TaxID=1069075 RepID=A0AAW0RFZ9_9HYPO